jgi:hypothetical protein
MLRERSRSRSLEDEVRDHTAAAKLAQDALVTHVESIQRQMSDNRVVLENLAMVKVLTGQEVAHALDEARRSTDIWVFKGGTGTYMRAVTLPECVGHARRGRRPLRVRMEIVDPANTDACDRYARFRRSLSHQPDGTGEIWTSERVRKESYATVLAGAWWRRQYDLLEVEIGLAPTMTTLRWDLSASRVIITQEDPSSPALMIERPRFYYDRVSTELRTSHEQARKVNLDQANDAPLSEEPTVDEVQKFFLKLGMHLPSSFTDRDVSDVIRRALYPKNPYENDELRRHRP